MPLGTMPLVMFAICALLLVSLALTLRLNGSTHGQSDMKWVADQEWIERVSKRFGSIAQEQTAPNKSTAVGIRVFPLGQLRKFHFATDNYIAEIYVDSCLSVTDFNGVKP